MNIGDKREGYGDGEGNKEGNESEEKREVDVIRKLEFKKRESDLSTAKLMTINEASAFLNLKVSKLRSMVFRKEIPFIKFGRLVRFHAQDVEAWLQLRRSPQSGLSQAGHGTRVKSIFEIDTRFSKANSKGNCHD